MSSPLTVPPAEQFARFVPPAERFRKQRHGRGKCLKVTGSVAACPHSTEMLVKPANRAGYLLPALIPLWVWKQRENDEGMKNAPWWELQNAPLFALRLSKTKFFSAIKVGRYLVPPAEHLGSGVDIGVLGHRTFGLFMQKYLIVRTQCDNYVFFCVFEQQTTSCKHT